ncbi:MAG: hypothetical protein VXA34_00935 [Gammaproteobacteria bacterium]
MAEWETINAGATITPEGVTVHEPEARAELWSNVRGIRPCQECGEFTHLLWRKGSGMWWLHLQCAYAKWPELDSSREQA